MPAACSDESSGFGSSPQKNSRKVLLHLLIVSIAVIVLDITVIVLEFSGYHIIQISYKELAYSIKLKLEISVLSRLVKFVQARRMGSSGRVTTHDDLEVDPVVEQAFYPHQCECRLGAENEKLEVGRGEHAIRHARKQPGYHGGNKEEAYPAQDLTVDRIA